MLRPEILNPLFATLTGFPGVGPKLGKLVAGLCGSTAADVLWHLPCGVNHRPVIQNLSDIISGQFATLPLQITDHLPPPNRRVPYRIIGQFADRTVELVFFNYHKSYLQSAFPIGQTRWVSGRTEFQGQNFRIAHPDYVATTPDDIPVYEVIYPQSRGVSSKIIRRILAHLWPHLPRLPEWLDPAYQAQHHLPFWHDALQQAHHPRSPTDLLPTHPARLRLAYDEVLANQLALMLVRANRQKTNGLTVRGTGDLITRLQQNLPFTLTNAQTRVLIEIQRDLESPVQMTRLLQGDVGSGKTIVALLAMLTSAEAGFQAVLMAPTDILARQHFTKIQALCAPLGVRVGLLTAREKGKTRAAILEQLSAGAIQILIGTHALLTDTVAFHRLGLVVIDEQHKFGVHQRLALVKKQHGVNLLVMTATPIPRSLALTVYGDMDISRLDEKPHGRQPIETRVMPIDKIPDLVARLKQKIATNSPRTQAYWICPLVEESQTSDLTAVKARYTALRQVFGDRVGLVHGQMKGPEKDAVMEQFAAGDLDILVATTVIEVGVDVKSATIMIIEHAERFGLAGLHQLRGRVGRGSDKSQCILLHGRHLTDTARQRLTVMRETDDGFVLAEEDLKLRGAGEVLGARQSGLPEFKMADPAVQGDLLLTATQDARTILSLDPHLTGPRGQALRLLLYLFHKETELQTLKAG